MKWGNQKRLGASWGVVRVTWGEGRLAELLSTENQAREKQEDGVNFPAGSDTLRQRERPSHLVCLQQCWPVAEGREA